MEAEVLTKSESETEVEARNACRAYVLSGALVGGVLTIVIIIAIVVGLVYGAPDSYFTGDFAVPTENSTIFTTVLEDTSTKTTTKTITTTTTSTTTTSTTITTTRPSCHWSNSSGRFVSDVPESVSELSKLCVDCLSANSSVSPSRSRCRLWCYDDGDGGDVWMLLSRRNFSRGLDCIFSHARYPNFESGFGCDEEVFFGLKAIHNATDPVLTHDMFELLVGIDRNQGEKMRKKSFVVHEFYLSELSEVFYDGRTNRNVAKKTFPDDGSGAMFCNSASQSCNINVEGAYWTKGFGREIVVCAACCNSQDFDSGKTHKVVELFFRRKRCKVQGYKNSSAEVRYQLKIPPKLNCLGISDTKLTLKTGMGKTTVTAGNNSDGFWCSQPGGVTILRRRPKSNSEHNCIFGDADKWSRSKYRKGFGCRGSIVEEGEFFIGLNNAEKIKKGLDIDRKSTYVELRIETKNHGKYKETGRVKTLSTTREYQHMMQIGDVIPNSNDSILYQAYEDRDNPSWFCKKDNVSECASLEARWWMMRSKTSQMMNEVCLTCCGAEEMARDFGHWNNRTITQLEMYLTAKVSYASQINLSKANKKKLT